MCPVRSVTYVSGRSINSAAYIGQKSKRPPGKMPSAITASGSCKWSRILRLRAGGWRAPCENLSNKLRLVFSSPRTGGLLRPVLHLQRRKMCITSPIVRSFACRSNGQSRSLSNDNLSWCCFGSKMDSVSSGNHEAQHCVMRNANGQINKTVTLNRLEFANQEAKGLPSYL